MIFKKILFVFVFSILLFSCEKFDSTGEGVTVESFDINSYNSYYYFPFVYENDIHVVSRQGEIFKFDSKNRQFERLLYYSYYDNPIMGGIVELNGKLFLATSSDVYRLSEDFEVKGSVLNLNGISGISVHNNIMYVFKGTSQIYQSKDGAVFTYNDTPGFISQIVNYQSKVYGIGNSGIYAFNGDKWILEIATSDLVGFGSFISGAKITGFVVTNDKFIISYKLDTKFYTLQCSDSFGDIEIKTPINDNNSDLYIDPESDYEFIICRSFLLNNDQFFNLPFGLKNEYYNYGFGGLDGTGSENFSTGGARIMENPNLKQCIGAIQFQNQIITYNIEKNKVVIITGSK